MVKFIFENVVPNTKSLTIVTDMWSSKSQAEKYLGLRLYFIDNQWRFRSFLLGTRHFRPSYGERDGGIRAPFKRWIEQILTDFGLSLTNIFGATSDAGADVKWMLTEGLKLRWEWCIPHMTNAVTKAARGIVNDKTKSKNKPMTELISRIGRTVYQVRHVEVMGSLFSDLCEMTGESRSRTLIEFKPHRFMGLTKVILRILEKWDQLVVWFDERINRALRVGLAPPEGFPLAADKMDLIQLVCILEPITLLNRRAQSESANQIDVLLTLYRLRQNVLDPSVALVDYRTKLLHPPRYFSVTELTPLVAKTRQLLADAFHDRFFSRYTNRPKVRKMSYIFEIQLLLHPKLKNPDGVLTKMIRLCKQQLVIDLAHPAKRLRPDEVSRMVTYVKTTILDQLKSLMLSTTPALDVPPMPSTNSQPFVFSEDLMEFYEQDDGVADAPANNAQISRIEDVLEQWISQPVTMGRNEENQAEHPTQSYLFLPSVARVPSSSAQIERDFGVSGMMVTSQRCSISAMNIDMCSFLNRNRDFIDVTQCLRLQGDEYRNNIPTNVLLPMEDDSDYLDISAEWENVMTTCFSESVVFEEG
ncbi:hypothetical protein DVH05_017166 [Phytophthora capsici]|nr:hypothetical protein DVH05_017166 [Phytophthora capsici]